MITIPSEAAEIIKNGGVVAIPTETVYGLAADAFNIQAVLKTFEAKGRPADNPLIVHISNLEQLKKVAVNIPESAFLLANSFWPGPLTLVLQKHFNVPDIVTGGLPTVAVRMPDHSLALEVIQLAGPVTAPSANRSGTPSPTRAEHVQHDYQNSIPVLDGGISRIGIESTVLDLTDEKPIILRPGAVIAEIIKEKTGISVFDLENSDSRNRTKSPGTRYTHYKPVATVEWLEPESKNIESKTYYIFHSDLDIQPAPNSFHYRGDFDSMARDLYDHFRTADHLSCTHIKIEPLPNLNKSQILPALMDRISKAIGS
tara:strand:+ start:76442 stop:77383 length:942 start_codon:yes stop_codon:yes gene_type:complete